MKVTDRTRAALAARREQRALLSERWRRAPVWDFGDDFQIVLGERGTRGREVVDNFSGWLKFGAPK